ncbi:MAG: GNAT family N-acetyltransferase [Pseudomonadota bacterium]
MTADDMAKLHKASFAPERGWNAAEFENFLRAPHCEVFSRAGGFALLSVIAGEAELLTLAVHPERRRQGIADAIMKEWMQAVDAGTAHLEVAADNEAALSLYAKHGFSCVGRRRAYYTRPGGTPVDAVLMQASLRL